MDRNSPSDDSDTDELPEEKRDSNIDTLYSSNTRSRGLNAADEAQLTAEEVAELRRARRRRNNRDSARRVRARRVEELAELQRKVGEATWLGEQLSGSCLQLQRDRDFLEANKLLVDMDRHSLAASNASLRSSVAAIAGEAAVTRLEADPCSSAIYHQARGMALALMQGGAPWPDPGGACNGRPPPSLSHLHPPAELLGPICGLNLHPHPAPAANEAAAGVWQQQPQIRQPLTAPPGEPLEGATLWQLPLDMRGSSIALPTLRSEPRAAIMPSLHRRRAGGFPAHECLQPQVSLPSMASRQLPQQQQRPTHLPHSLASGRLPQHPQQAQPPIQLTDPYVPTPDLFSPPAAGPLMPPGYPTPGPYDLDPYHAMSDQEFADSMQLLQRSQHLGSHLFDVPQQQMLLPHHPGLGRHDSPFDSIDALLLFDGRTDKLGQHAQVLQQHQRQQDNWRSPADQSESLSDVAMAPQMISWDLLGLGMGQPGSILP